MADVVVLVITSSRYLSSRAGRVGGAKYCGEVTQLVQTAAARPS